MFALLIGGREMRWKEDALRTMRTDAKITQKKSNFNKKKKEKEMEILGEEKRMYKDSFHGKQ